MGKYDDIINLPHHVSSFYKPMSMINRAAQFAPFSALTGYEEAIEEKARLTEKMPELSENERSQLSALLDYAIQTRCVIEISYFEKDQLKSGGSYKKTKGIIAKIDEIDRTITLNTGKIIYIPSIVSIQA